jgi:predicted RNA binding protein YcfA (HicA-like mRNA interferase family)
MTRLDDLKADFLACSGPFLYRDLCRLLTGLDFEETQTGGGSRRRFVHAMSKRIIRLHEPHPAKEVKAYVVRQIKQQLIDMGLL